MFLNEKVLNNLMKQAYKSDGLVIAQNEDNWVYIAGRFWETEIKREYIPKHLLVSSQSRERDSDQTSREISMKWKCL